MIASPCLFPSGTARQAVRFIVPVVICVAFTATCLAQSHQLERSFPVSNKPKLIVLNARKISISPWDRDEVLITAASTDSQVRDEDFRIQQKEDRLEIWCHPLLDKAVSIVLRVPSKSILRLEAYDYEVEITNPSGAISMGASKNSLYFDVPESAAFDARGVSGVTRISNFKGGFTISSSLGSQRFGEGFPFVKVSAKGAHLTVKKGSAGPAAAPPSVAARTIAGKTGLMSQALRESVPELGKASVANNTRSKTEEAAPLKEIDGEALKLETYLVNLNVSVTDRDGKAISGLSQTDFSVLEDGDLQQISFFSPEQASFNLVLLIDLSGSLRERGGLIKEAAIHFLDLIGPRDSVAVITFTTDVTVVSHLTKDREKLRESILSQQTPAGGTAFYDALGYVLVEELSKVRGQRNAVIAITDGQDNSLLPWQRPNAVQKQLIDAGLGRPTPKVGSWLTFEQLLEGVFEADALIYPVHLQHGNALNSTSPDATTIGGRPVDQVAAEITTTGKKQLQELADASGGRLFSAARIEDLKSVYEQVAAELRTVYSIAYNTKNLRFDGKFRRTRVTVSKPGAAVRSRRGYYATPRRSN